MITGNCATLLSPIFPPFWHFVCALPSASALKALAQTHRLIWQKNWPCCQHLNTHTDHIRTQTWYMYIFKSHCFVENLLMMHYWSSHIDLCHSREKRNPGSPQIPSVSHFSSSLDPSSQLWKRGQDVAHVGWITLEQLPRQVLACTVALNVWIPAT